MKLAASKNLQPTVMSLRRVVLNGTLQAIEKGSYELQTEEDPVSFCSSFAFFSVVFVVQENLLLNRLRCLWT